MEEETEKSKITGKTYPVKGLVEKYYFYASSVFCKVLDNLTISSVFAVLVCWLLGAGHLIILFVSIALVSFLIRLGIAAFNSNKGGYSPIATEYRVSMLENELERVNGILGETVT